MATKKPKDEYERILKKLRRYRHEISQIRYDLNHKKLTKKEKQKLSGMLGGRVAFMKNHSVMAYKYGMGRW